MSQGNVDNFMRLAEAINRGDPRLIPDLVHPEMVAEPLRAKTEGAYVGHQGTRDFIADTAATFDLFRTEYGDIRDLGDRVLAIGLIRVRGRESGVETEIPTAVIAEYRDGLVWRFKDYGEAGLALRAAGLAE